MVGRGYLKPDLTKVRRDTPKILHLLLERCIKFTRQERPEFEQVLRYLERASADLPRLKRSVSEPQLHRTRFEPNDFTMQLQSPNTPQLPAAANFPLFSAYNLSEHL